MCGRRDGHCSGRYASCWNIFLFHRCLSDNGGGGGWVGNINTSWDRSHGRGPLWTYPNPHPTAADI